VSPDSAPIVDGGPVVKMTGVPRAITLQHNATKGKVVANRLLSKPGVPTKRHIGEIYPSGFTGVKVL
jgi:hypothetical protein